MLPGASLEFREYDHLRFEYETPVILQGIVADISLPIFKKYDRLSSNLRTSIQYPLHSSQKISAKAFMERNGMVPQLQGNVNHLREAQRLLKDFLRLCKYQDSFKIQQIRPDMNNLSEWIAGQPPCVVKIIESEDSFYDQNVTVYDFIVKSIPKIDLEIGAEFRYKAPQTIAFQKKIVNSVFCPILKEFMDRIESVIHPDIVIYNNMSPQEFSSHFSQVFPLYRYEENKNFYEIDFSKYDKSQGLLILIFEALIMEAFGVPAQFIKYWVLMHRFTTIIDRLNRFSARVEYQRKSGDAGTWRLNTVVQIAVLNTTLKLYNKIKLNECVACFSGDDSLIFCKYIHDMPSKLTILQTRYNLEAKLMNYKVPYFCSKFLIIADNNWIFVPDTLKLICKLGRNDLVDLEHVKSYRISFDDNLYYYKNRLNWTFISEAINDRYKSHGEHDYVYEALLYISANDERFSKLYSKGIGFVEGVISSKPSLDL